MAVSRSADSLLGRSVGEFGWKQTVALVAGAALVVIGSARGPPTDDGRLRPTLERSLPLLAIGAAGALVVWGTLAGLDQSLWHDELFSVVYYTSEGPSQILFGDYVPNNHLLFNLVAWASSGVLGDSEVAYRLGSVLPAIAAAAIVVWWAWGALGRWTAATVALLIAVSPVHHDLAREARGYGLALLAAAVMLVFAFRVASDGRRRDLVVLGLAGVVGGFTIPQFAIGFTAQALPLLARRELRRRIVVLLGGVGGVLLLIYAPLLSDVIDSTGTVSGGPLPWHAPLTGPLEHLLQPDLDVIAQRTTDAYFITPNGADQIIAGALVVVGGLRLWRGGDRALLGLLVVPPVFTYLVLTVGAFHVHERYGSFLLFHALVLAAVGIVALVQAFPAGVLRYAAAGVAALLAAVAFGRAIDRDRLHEELPRENFKRVAEIVDGQPAAEILAYSTHPDGLRYYLAGRKLVFLAPEQLEAAFCSSRPPAIFVEQPFRGPTDPPPPDARCLARSGAVRVRAHQRDRAEHIDVWLLGRQGGGE